MACLVFAPWAFGCTEVWSIRILEFLCILTGVTQGAAMWRDRPVVLRRPWLLLAGGLALGVVGFQLMNSMTIETLVEGSSFELTGGNPAWPHTVCWDATLLQGVRWGCLFLFGMAVLHHLRTVDDARHFLMMIVFNALVLALAGILFSLSGTDNLLGIREMRYGGSPFGPFVCKNNYAAYANLALPLAIGLALFPDMLSRTVHGREVSKTPRRIFWGFAAGVLLTSVFLSVSRAGGVVTLVLSCVMLVDYVIRRRVAADGWRAVRLLALTGAGAGLVVYLGGHKALAGGFERLDLLDPTRMDVWKSVWGAVDDSPWWGFGLGTFRYIFPFYQPVQLVEFYDFAHSDWLEALFDFGWLGVMPLAAGVCGMTFVLACDRFRRTSPFRRSLASCALVSLGGCLAHAWVDFPLHIASIQVTFAAIASIGLSGRYLD
ncbi:MAG: O-antigen ligase family protein [Verrucomicrobiae bacterium]|nr:O-antigen ligase family protein [Verrucomicrobiae bacterium]